MEVSIRCRICSGVQTITNGKIIEQRAKEMRNIKNFAAYCESVIKLYYICPESNAVTRCKEIEGTQRGFCSLICWIWFRIVPCKRLGERWAGWYRAEV